MIYILAYIVLGISTAVSIRYNGANGAPVIAACFIWPLYWFAFVFAHFVGWMPAKCAWCGKTVAGHAHMDKWRAHYLDECDKHPLAIKCKRLERYLDETDAKNTANRVRREKLEELYSDAMRWAIEEMSSAAFCAEVLEFEDELQGPKHYEGEG